MSENIVAHKSCENHTGCKTVRDAILYEVFIHKWRTVPTIAGATFQLATLTGGVAVEHDYAQGSDEEAIVFSFPLRKDDVVNVIKRA